MVFKHKKGPRLQRANWTAFHLSPLKMPARKHLLLCSHGSASYADSQGASIGLLGSNNLRHGTSSSLFLALLSAGNTLGEKQSTVLKRGRTLGFSQRNCLKVLGFGLVIVVKDWGLQESSIAAASLVAGKDRENFGTGYLEYKKRQRWQQSWKGKVQNGKLLFIHSKIHEEHGRNCCLWVTLWIFKCVIGSVLIVLGSLIQYYCWEIWLLYNPKIYTGRAHNTNHCCVEWGPAATRESLIKQTPDWPQ